MFQIASAKEATLSQQLYYHLIYHVPARDTLMVWRKNQPFKEYDIYDNVQPWMAKVLKFQW